MAESVLVALITGILAIIGSYVSSSAAAKKKDQENAVKEAEREARQAIRLESIEKKLDIHNGYAEKFGDIQQNIAVIKRDIEYLKENDK